MCESGHFHTYIASIICHNQDYILLFLIRGLMYIRQSKVLNLMVSKR